MWRGLGWGQREEEESVSTDTVTEGEDEEEIFDPTSIHPSGWLALALSAPPPAFECNQARRMGPAEGGRRGAAPQGIMSWMERNVASKMKTLTPTPKR